MIDLKKIEAKIDSLLESESKESMTNWILNHRAKYVLGKGCFVELKTKRFEVMLDITEDVFFDNTIDVSVCNKNDYQLAC